MRLVLLPRLRDLRGSAHRSHTLRRWATTLAPQLPVLVSIGKLPASIMPPLARHAFLLSSLCAAALALSLQGCDSGADTERNPPQANEPIDTFAPTAPSELTATPIGTNRIDLSWLPSSDANGIASYRIFRDDFQTELTSVDSTSYSDTNLTADTEYTYAVRAVDPAGNVSEPSASIRARTLSESSAQTSGLDTRPSNTSCTAWPRSSGTATIQLERYASLSFTTPIGMLQAPGDSSRWFVVQQNGIVLRFATAAPTSTAPFVDIQDRVRSGGEMGLLGMAFHPEFPSDPRVFLSYTTGTPLVSRISAFTTADGGATLNAASEQVLLSIDQPQQNHNGGHIAFGPDGYLYIGIGDGGGSNDNHGDIGNGQRLTTLLGKMLRIDIDGAAPYSIPSTNPFAQNTRCPASARATGACPEIYAYGFRNPWRWSFDRTRGQLWVADVGQNQFEEVNRVSLGGNYGWRCREGAHDFASSSTPGCDQATAIDPVSEYGRSLGNSITGGYVYRGNQSTSLVGTYLFGDFGSGRIFAWNEDASSRAPTVLLESGLSISSFGEANDGELYVVHYGGTLHRIVFAGSSNPVPAPATLSATGCVVASDPSLPASGLIPYSVSVPFWSDGADKQRWIALPDGQNIAVQGNGDWDLPNGTVLLKHFRTGAQLIETRLFMRHPDGVWGGFSYAWNAQQTDAALVQGGAERDVGLPEPWIFPSESQCLECHTSAAGRTLGLETAQLNGEHTYESTGRTANQLATLSHIGVLTPAISDPAAERSMPDPTDESAPLNDRARAYLHANCSFCHRPEGPTPSTVDLRYSTVLNATNTCDVSPQSGDLGVGANARIIAPGSSGNSILVNRMNRRDEFAMPPLGSNQIDSAGVALISEWIGGLSGC